MYRIDGRIIHKRKNHEQEYGLVMDGCVVWASCENGQTPQSAFGNFFKRLQVRITMRRFCLGGRDGVAIMLESVADEPDFELREAAFSKDENTGIYRIPRRDS